MPAATPPSPLYKSPSTSPSARLTISPLAILSQAAVAKFYKVKAQVEHKFFKFFKFRL